MPVFNLHLASSPATYSINPTNQKLKGYA